MISAADGDASAERPRPDTEALIAEIRSQLGGKDSRVLDFVLSNYEEGGPCEEFYRKALDSSVGFVREYFRYDLNVRNTKVEYLNSALGRPEGMDIVLPEESGGYDGQESVIGVLEGSDILARERGLDDLMWKKAEELTLLHIFDLDIILSFVVRLKIIHRWLRLDEAAGREYFRKLVNEIRNRK